MASFERSVIPPLKTTADTARKALRAELQARRDGRNPAQKHLFDIQLQTHLLAWCATVDIRTLAVYWPIRSEPELHAAYEELTKRGIQLALPVIIAASAPLRFALWTPGDALSSAKFGIAVPANKVWAEPQALLLPCLGFNEAHFRLGYGGGFYDRTLEHHPRPLTAGIAYSDGLTEFTVEAHDIALDCIITEHGTR